MKSPQIMIVGDLQLSRRLMMTVLTKLGYEVVAIESASEALHMLTRRSYSLCLIALHLNDRSGIALAETIRESDGALRLIPVILFGDAWDRDGVLKECHRLDLQNYLPKPISVARLVEVVNENLGPDPNETTDNKIDNSMQKALDLELLNQITGGDAQLQNELGVLYLATATQYLGTMKAALSSDGDANDDWRRAAHALKGASMNFGATSVAETAREAENMTPEEGLVSSLEDKVSEVTLALESMPRAQDARG